MTQTVYLENSSNFFSKFQIRGRELDRLPGKLIHWKIMSTYSVFSKIGSWARPFTWKTHPFDFFNKIIYDMKRLVKSIDYQLLNCFFLRKEIRPTRERQDYRDFMLRVAQGFCANSLKPATAPLRVRNRTFSRSKCKSCHDISPYKDSRTSKYCDRCNSATCSNHAKILCRQCFAS